MRGGVKELVKVIEEKWHLGKTRESGLPVVFFYAPVGYGKSTAAPLVAEVSKMIGIAHSLVHVLPSRSLVHNLFLCKYAYSVVDDMQIKEEIREKCNGRVANQEFIQAAKNLVSNPDRVVYQAGIYIERFRKSPMFEDFDIMVTTFDSFMYAVLKNPVTEIYSHKKHYAIPFSWIYTSLIYLDEAHVYANSEERELIRALIENYPTLLIPIIATTATPTPTVEEIVKAIKKNAVVVKPCCSENEIECSGSNNNVCFVDKEFDQRVKSVDWHTTFIKKGDIESTVKRLVEKEDNRVLIAIDGEGAVEKAVELYKSLKSTFKEQLAVLHGKMTKEQQKRVLELKNIRVLISTPVINVGVDLSFDALIAIASKPETLIQFAGRVCRDNDCKVAKLYIVEDESDKQLVSVVKQYIEEGAKINWHLYCESDKRETTSRNDRESVQGYMAVIRRFYSEHGGAIQGQLRVDRKRYFTAHTLLQITLLSSDEIERLYSETGYSLIRDPLAEVLALSEEKLKCIRDCPCKEIDDDKNIEECLKKCLNSAIKEESGDIFDVLRLKTITLSFDHAVKLADRVITAKIKATDYGYQLSIKCHPVNKEFAFPNYWRLHRIERPDFTAFILKNEKCFDEEMGLWCPE